MSRCPTLACRSGLFEFSGLGSDMTSSAGATYPPALELLGLTRADRYRGEINLGRHRRVCARRALLLFPWKCMLIKAAASLSACGRRWCSAASHTASHRGEGNAPPQVIGILRPRKVQTSSSAIINVIIVRIKKVSDIPRRSLSAVGCCQTSTSPGLTSLHVFLWLSSPAI